MAYIVHTMQIAGAAGIAPVPQTIAYAAAAIATLHAKLVTEERDHFVTCAAPLPLNENRPFEFFGKFDADPKFDRTPKNIKLIKAAFGLAEGVYNRISLLVLPERQMTPNLTYCFISPYTQVPADPRKPVSVFPALYIVVAVTDTLFAGMIAAERSGWAISNKSSTALIKVLNYKGGSFNVIFQRCGAVLPLNILKFQPSCNAAFLNPNGTH
jgi:hypothetical protein